MAQIFLAVGVVLLVGTFAVLWRCMGMVTALERSRIPDVAAMETRLAVVEVKVEGLPSLWEDIRERTHAAAERLRAQNTAAARRARQEREERDQLPETGPDLPDLDGAGSEGGGVLSLRDRVAANAAAGSGPVSEQDTFRALVRARRGW